MSRLAGTMVVRWRAPGPAAASMNASISSLILFSSTSRGR